VVPVDVSHLLHLVFPVPLLNVLKDLGNGFVADWIVFPAEVLKKANLPLKE
jgi:hypothetical protein